MIPHTNLILIVADKLCPCYSKVSIEPQEVKYGANGTESCMRMKYNIFRKRPLPCFRSHKEVTFFYLSRNNELTFMNFFQEGDIKLCGSGFQFRLSSTVVAFTVAVLVTVMHVLS